MKQIFKNKKRSYERKTGNKIFLVFAVVPLFALSLWALAISVNNYNKTSVYRKTETQAALNSFSDSFSIWCKTYLATHFEKFGAKIPFIKKIVVTDVNGNPIIPDYSFKLKQCETSAYARIVENYFSETQWEKIPVFEVTNDCTAYVVKEPILAAALAKLPSVKIALGWQMAADAVRKSQTNRAVEIYKLMQTEFPQLVDINGFPVKLTAQLEELKLSNIYDNRKIEHIFEDVIYHYDFRHLAEMRETILALFKNTIVYQEFLDFSLPQTENPCSFSVTKNSKVLNCNAWFQSTLSHRTFRFVDCIRQNWLTEISEKASNTLVKIIVRQSNEPAPVGEFLSTNIFGNVISIIPFDAEKWEKKHKVKKLVQIILLALFLILLIGLSVRAVAFARAENALTMQQLNFIAAVSHELRTPIASTRILAETISRGVIKKPEEQKEYANLIVSESDNLTRLVDNILDVFNNGKKANFTFEKVSVNNILKNVIKTYSLSNPTTEINLIINSDLEICCDVHAIERVFHNLIDNAIKYSEPDSKIDIIIREKNKFCEIIIRDYGIGIPENEFKNIFKKFYRVGDELTRERPGAGLGLAIVKEIIEAHNGKIYVKSWLGKGSEFVVCLKLEIRN